MKRITATLKNYQRVIENFFSLGLINVLNSSFHLIIYPILIRRIGAEAYGLYVYAFSIVTYFTTLTTYGLDMIGSRYLAIYDKENDIKGKEDITSKLISSKLYLTILASLIFACILLITALSTIRLLTLATYISIIGYIFMPNWYYLGIQNMRVYLVIQLLSKLMLMIAIIFLIHSASDLPLYALLMSLSIIISCIIAFFYVIYKDGIRLKVTSLRNCLPLLKESTPLFLSNLLITVKTSGLNIVIGNLFGMTTLTGYDFSMKVVSAVNAMSKNINTALFPSVSASYSNNKANKLFRFEILFGITMMGILMLLAKPIIIVMGNGPIIDQVLPIFTIMTILLPLWLISGFFIELVLTANGLNQQVFWNQAVSLLIICVGVAIAMIFDFNVLHFAIVLVLAGIAENFYLYYLSRKYMSFQLH